MPNLSDLIGGGGKPKLITTYTSGTGTYIPTADMARCLVRLQAGGAGGYTSNHGGGGGAMTEWFIRIPIAGLAYVVGAGGSVQNDGSRTTLGPCCALPGKHNGAPGPGIGGPVGLLLGGTDADGATIMNSGLQGVAGGYGGTIGQPGGLAGYPASSPNMTGAYYGIGTSNTAGNSGGGDSFYGAGGASGSSPAAGAYGAGGGSNAAGAGGYIEIWDFGE